MVMIEKVLQNRYFYNLLDKRSKNLVHGSEI